MKDEKIPKLLEEMSWITRNYDIHLTDAEKTKLFELWDIFIQKMTAIYSSKR